MGIRAISPSSFLPLEREEVGGGDPPAVIESQRHDSKNLLLKQIPTCLIGVLVKNEFKDGLYEHFEIKKERPVINII